jgi:hypothetical protein
VLKILYKPFSIVAGILGARVAKTIFKSLWSRIDADDPPKPTTADTNMPKVVGAAALEAATMASVTAAFDRASAQTFHYFTGIWPGEKSGGKKSNGENGDGEK